MVVIVNLKKKSIVFILEFLLLFAYNQISKPVESKILDTQHSYTRK